MSPSITPSGSLPPFAPAPLSPLAHRLFAFWLALAVAALAIVVGLLVPHWIPLAFLQEEGPVERGTVWVYLAAVLSVPLLRWRGMSVADGLAACVLLLAMAAREADLHTALFGISILKSHFYLHAPASQIAVALCVLAPIVAAGLWLLVRHAQQWRVAPARWSPPAVTLAVLVATMVVAKVLDRTPDTLGQLHLREQVPMAAIYVMLALEEILEFALPVFAIVAMLQCRLLALRQNVTK
ncbi:hypothetical protein [Pseudorhodoferax sp.]|uniref:hypothetical protein n=1 Tax=Pseudorhodoferax sp. TaxID=1993553 RepID=UPI002DD6BA0B|nr:hypothetical protein [Pseudorhodoferax sp.]